MPSSSTTITSNGSTTPQVVNGAMLSFALAGTFGGATVKIQGSIDEGATFNDIPGASYTSASGLVNLAVVAGMSIKALTSSASGATSITFQTRH